MRIALAIIIGAACVALLIGLGIHRVPGRMHKEGGKPRVEIKRACPCDSLKNKKRIFSFP